MSPCLFIDLKLADIPPSIRRFLKAAAFVLLFFLVRLFISNKNVLCTSEVCLLEDLNLSWFQLGLNHNTTLLNMVHIYGTMWMVNVFVAFMGTLIMGEHQEVFFSPRALKFPLYELHVKICESWTVHFTVFSVSQKEEINKRTSKFYWGFFVCLRLIVYIVFCF